MRLNEAVAPQLTFSPLAREFKSPTKPRIFCLARFFANMVFGMPTDQQGWSFFGSGTQNQVVPKEYGLALLDIVALFFL